MWSRYLIALIMVGLLVACSPVLVTRMDSTFDDLTGFDSYRWGTSPLVGGGHHDADLFLQDHVVRKMVKAQMALLGFSQQAFGKDADLVVDYQLRFTPEQYADMDQPEGGWVWKRDREGQLQRSRVEPDVKVTIDRMVLRLTVHNSGRNQVLWLAEANYMIDPGHPPQEMEQALNQMVLRLFKQFPVGKD